MDNKKLDVVKTRNAFIAALDQSGGSSGKTLSLYGIDKDRYNTEKEMFDLIHKFRKRIITSKVFNNEKILGVILFEDTMNRKINNKYVSKYLWDDKGLVSFLKIDKGLEEKENGVKLMRPIIDLEKTLMKAKSLGIFGTKMRSVIYENNSLGIKEVVNQQFTLARTIWNNGLVPIIEPEVDINSKDKPEIERKLKLEIDKKLEEIEDDMKVIFKFTLPSIDNFYHDYINNEKVLRVVALSGGYDRDKACDILEKNNGVIASFSRALLQDLREGQTDKEFDIELEKSINQIYEASIK